MKNKLLYIFLSALIILNFSCSKNSSSKNINALAKDINTSAENTVALPANITAPAENINSPAANINIPVANATTQAENINASLTNNAAQKKIDIDLTNASKTIIYATVFNMVVEPDDFIGKTVRVSGNFRVFEDDYSDDRYYAIIIPDATACCETGIEFIWEGEHNYPEDYPAVEQEITITGKYNVMEFEDGVSYFYLDVSDIEF